MRRGDNQSQSARRNRLQIFQLSVAVGVALLGFGSAGADELSDLRRVIATPCQGPMPGIAEEGRTGCTGNVALPIAPFLTWNSQGQMENLGAGRRVTVVSRINELEDGSLKLIDSQGTVTRFVAANSTPVYWYSALAHRGDLSVITPLASGGYRVHPHPGAQTFSDFTVRRGAISGGPASSPSGGAIPMSSGSITPGSGAGTTSLGEWFPSKYSLDPQRSVEFSQYSGAVPQRITILPDNRGASFIVDQDRITGITDFEGLRYQITYNQVGDIESVTQGSLADSNARSLFFKYDPAGLGLITEVSQRADMEGDPSVDPLLGQNGNRVMPGGRVAPTSGREVEPPVFFSWYANGVLKGSGTADESFRVYYEGDVASGNRDWIVLERLKGSAGASGYQAFEYRGGFLSQVVAKDGAFTQALAAGPVPGVLVAAFGRELSGPHLGRLLWEQDDLGVKTTYHYTAAGDCSGVQGATGPSLLANCVKSAGVSTTYRFGTGFNPTPPDVRALSAASFPTTRTDSFYVTKATTANVADPSQLVTNTLTFTDDGRPKSYQVTDRYGREASRYDAEYDGSGNLTSLKTKETTRIDGYGNLPQFMPTTFTPSHGAEVKLSRSNPTTYVSSILGLSQTTSFSIDGASGALNITDRFAGSGLSTVTKYFANGSESQSGLGAASADPNILSSRIFAASTSNRANGSLASSNKLFSRYAEYTEQAAGSYTNTTTSSSYDFKSWMGR